jgi:hypothetical protein
VKRIEIRPAAAAALVVVVTVTITSTFAHGSHPVDCLPDEIVEWQAAEPAPETRFGAAFLPGIVLGPPGDSLPIQGSTSVASLGNGGVIVLRFTDVVIEDGPGPDFIVFENPFFVGAAPTSSADDYRIFAEPGIVEVSVDGVTWITFPFDAQALADALGADIDPGQYLALQGLAGLTPTFTGSWTVPNNPLDFDPAGTGGISGAGGDAFDLSAVGLAEARWIRITDAGSQNGPTGAAEGFDLETVVILHGRPVPPATADRDGDRLPDLAEVSIYGTDPDLLDSDADGIDDGREVAACRDPAGFGDAPLLALEPRLWLDDDDGCTAARWTFLGTGLTYDLIRGEVASLAEDASAVDLGPTTCLADGHLTVSWSCDATVPSPSQRFFYVVRATGESHFGRSSGLKPREAAAACP